MISVWEKKVVRIWIRCSKKALYCRKIGEERGSMMAELPLVTLISKNLRGRIALPWLVLLHRIASPCVCAWRIWRWIYKLFKRVFFKRFLLNLTWLDLFPPTTSTTIHCTNYRTTSIVVITTTDTTTTRWHYQYYYLQPSTLSSTEIQRFRRDSGFKIQDSRRLKFLVSCAHFYTFVKHKRLFLQVLWLFTIYLLLVSTFGLVSYEEK